MGVGVDVNVGVGMGVKVAVGTGWTRYRGRWGYGRASAGRWGYGWWRCLHRSSHYRLRLSRDRPAGHAVNGRDQLPSALKTLFSIFGQAAVDQSLHLGGNVRALQPQGGHRRGDSAAAHFVVNLVQSFDHLPDHGCPFLDHVTSHDPARFPPYRDVDSI